SNSIKTIAPRFFESFSSTKDLYLQSQHLDVFLKTNILTTLALLETIDFSNSYITDNNHQIIIDYVPSQMKNLKSIDLSYTNLTEKMVIELLKTLSNSSINSAINVRLLGYRLNESNFCSYIEVDRNSLFIELDNEHPCNCVVDYFYQHCQHKADNKNSKSLLKIEKRQNTDSHFLNVC
ncbi:unnamed protein product, partial [Didymodactylos carnosus]